MIRIGTIPTSLAILLSYKQAFNGIGSGVARIWCKEGHETKRKQFKGDIKIYILKFMR